MKVYVVREVYGDVLGIFKDRKDAEMRVDKLYNFHISVAKEEEWLDFDMPNRNDWIVEEWEVE